MGIIGMKIKIKSGSVEVEAELNSSETAKKIFESLPLEGSVNTWGDEIYFDIPVSCEEENGQEEVEVGDLGYWLSGSCFCIFFGRTPVSTSDKPRAASNVNVFGKIIGDTEILKQIRSGDQIIVEKI